MHSGDAGDAANEIIIIITATITSGQRVLTKGSIAGEGGYFTGTM